MTDSREDLNIELTGKKLTAVNADDGRNKMEEELSWRLAKMICKALCSEANGISYGLLHDGYDLRLFLNSLGPQPKYGLCRMHGLVGQGGMVSIVQLPPSSVLLADFSEVNKRKTGLQASWLARDTSYPKASLRPIFR